MVAQWKDLGIDAQRGKGWGGEGILENLAPEAFLGFPVVFSPRLGPTRLMLGFVPFPTDPHLPTGARPPAAMTSFPTMPPPPGRWAPLPVQGLTPSRVPEFPEASAQKGRLFHHSPPSWHHKTREETKGNLMHTWVEFHGPGPIPGTTGVSWTGAYSWYHLELCDLVWIICPLSASLLTCKMGEIVH